MPDHATTLEQIARSHGESFYRGTLAEQIVAAAKRDGAAMSLHDLASHRADWVDTIHADYRGNALHEIPPNGQGLAALLALNILSQFSLREFPVDSADSFHLHIEAMKLALADAYRYVCDPAHADVRYEDLLAVEYAQQRSKLIDPKRATIAASGVPRAGGTVYLAAADASGMMVSFIQSNYRGFGSGIVIPGTGIAMQNRGAGFVLDRDHPNCVGPRKRPFHTIIPGFVMSQDGKPQMSFGVMGGPMQAQGHVQMMTRIFDYGQNPQAASDAPRWQVTEGLEVLVERGIAAETLDDLSARGHQLKLADGELFGGAQLIYGLDGGYAAGSDHRKDGCAVGF